MAGTLYPYSSRGFTPYGSYYYLTPAGENLHAAISQHTEHARADSPRDWCEDSLTWPIWTRKEKNNRDKRLVIREAFNILTNHKLYVKLSEGKHYTTNVIFNSFPYIHIHYPGRQGEGGRQGAGTWGKQGVGTKNRHGGDS